MLIAPFFNCKKVFNLLGQIWRLAQESILIALSGFFFLLISSSAVDVFAYSENSIDSDWKTLDGPSSSTRKNPPAKVDQEKNNGSSFSESPPVDGYYSEADSGGSPFSMDQFSRFRLRDLNPWAALGLTSSGLWAKGALYTPYAKWVDVGPRVSFEGVSGNSTSHRLLQFDFAAVASAVYLKRIEPFLGIGLGYAFLSEKIIYSEEHRSTSTGTYELFFGVRTSFSKRYGLEIYKAEQWLGDGFKKQDLYSDNYNFPSKGFNSRPVIVGFYGRL